MDNRRIGDWMQTAGGRMFWPMDPRVDEVFFDDIAHALANQCRYAGHCREFYSVAQHSVLVSLACDPADALDGLLHDAAEAYLVDLPRPVKRYSLLGEEYIKAEAAVARVIGARFGLRAEEPASVKRADAAVCLAEMRDLMAPPPQPWRERGVVPYSQQIVALAPADARRLFVERFASLEDRP